MWAPFFNRAVHCTACLMLQEEEGAANAARADKHQRSELLRAAHIRRIRAKAGDEARKVEEVSFINTLNNEGKKADLQQRLEEGEQGFTGAGRTQSVSLGGQHRSLCDVVGSVHLQAIIAA